MSCWLLFQQGRDNREQGISQSSLMPIGQHLSNRQHLTNAFTAEISAECHSSKSHWHWSKTRTKKKSTNASSEMSGPWWGKAVGAHSHVLRSSKSKLNWERNHAFPLEDTVSGLKLHENFQLLPILLISALRGTKTRAEIIPWFSQAQKFRRRNLKNVTYYLLYNFVVLRRWNYNSCLQPAMLYFIKYCSKTQSLSI